MNKIIIFVAAISIIFASCTQEDQDNYNMQISKLDSINQALRDGYARADSLANVDNSPQTPWDSLGVTEEEYYEYFVGNQTNLELLQPYQGLWRLVSVNNGAQDITTQYGELYFNITADSFNIDYSQKGVYQKGNLILTQYDYYGSSVNDLELKNIHRLDQNAPSNINPNQFFPHANTSNIVTMQNEQMILSSSRDILIGYDYLGKNTVFPNYGAVINGNHSRIIFVFERA